MTKSVMLLTLITVVMFQTTSAQKIYQTLRDSSFKEEVFTSGVLKKYKTAVLNDEQNNEILLTKPEIIELQIPASYNSVFTCNLKQVKLHDDSFRVSSPSGILTNYTEGVHYRGQLKNDTTSIVAFSFFEDCLYGLIATDSGNFNIVFLRDEKLNPSRKYVIYNDRDLNIQNDFSCSSDRLPAQEQEEENKPKSTEVINCRTVRQYLECDYKMFQDNGSSIQNTINWTTAMFNVSAGIFTNEEIDVKISEIFVWNTNDNYPSSNSSVALKAFGNLRQDNFNGHIAHLLSTKNESNGGLAWVNVLCKNYAANISYGRFAYSNINNSYQNLPLWSWTINAFTHETGHNLGSQHTHWCGWELSPGNYGAIDHCYPTEAYNGVQCYSGPTQPITGTLMSYCHLSGSVNLNLGFGPLPGAAIRKAVGNATCLGPSAPAVTGTLQYCAGESVHLTAASSSLGQLQWQGPNNFSANTANISIENAGTGNTGKYVASVVGTFCTASREVQVDVSSKPEQPIITSEQGGSLLKCENYNPAYQYEWYNESEEKMATSPTFVPPVSGRYFVKASNSGCRSLSSALYMTYNLLGISNSENKEEFTIWPNPSNGLVTIRWESKAIGSPYRIVLIDMNGRVLLERNESTMPIQLDLHAYSNGLYHIKIITDNETRYSKIILER